MSKTQSTSYKGSERRKALRRPVLGTFSLFLVIPKKGPQRLYIHDLSELGLGTDLEVEGEEDMGFSLTLGESLEVQLYLNQSLYLPLNVRVARLETINGVRRMGSEFSERTTQSMKALKAFVKMLDEILEVAEIQGQ